jgi:hypothetical protein
MEHGASATCGANNRIEIESAEAERRSERSNSRPTRQLVDQLRGWQLDA